MRSLFLIALWQRPVREITGDLFGIIPTNLYP
jgi:hypothetical protein